MHGCLDAWMDGRMNCINTWMHDCISEMDALESFVFLFTLRNRNTDDTSMDFVCICGLVHGPIHASSLGTN